jgi:predicted ferric reductase
MKTPERRKILILCLIGATSVAPAFFIQLDEAAFTLNLYKLLAKIGSLTGTSLFFWQFLTGFRQALPYAAEDYVWTIDLHKKTGIFACILILFHPVFITLFYLEKEGINPLFFIPSEPFGPYVLPGQISLAVIAVIFFTSAVFRGRISFDRWYAIHLSAFLLMPLAFIHSLPIGTTLLNTPLRVIWGLMIALVTAFYLYRLFCRLIFSARYAVSHTRKAAPDTTEITNHPRGRRITPKLSQFVFYARDLMAFARPYTVSGYNPETGELCITAKAMGKTSSALQTIPLGRTTYIDGPYGVFAVDIFSGDRPVVMIAGGIGITPFRRIYQEIDRIAPDRSFYLFYGNSHENEIAYREELDRVRHLQVIHAISDQPDFDGEKGYITAGLIRKYVKAPLLEHDFYICGPPVMTVKLKDELRKENIPPDQIRYELFDY